MSILDMSGRRAVALVACLFASGARHALSAQEREPVREDPYAREEYFWQQRTYPFATRPYDRMSQLRQVLASSSLVRGASRSVSVGAGDSWRSLGPFGFWDAGGGYFGTGQQLDAGRIASVAPSRKAGGPLFLGTASGGVWRSNNGGATWTPLTDTQCALTTGAVSVDPSNPSIVYAATGEGNQGSPGCGILRSSDGGSSWTLTGASSFRLVSGGSAGFYQILIDSATAGSTSGTTLLAASNVAIYRSTNSGNTWALNLTGAASSLVRHPTRPGLVFAGMNDNFTATRRGLYRSVDFGANWTQLPGLPGIDLATVGRIELAVSASAPDEIMALVSDRVSRKFLGLFKWNDATSTWGTLGAAGLYTGVSRGDFGNQGSYDLTIAIDPRNARNVYVAGVRAFHSTDGGATFRPWADDIHCDWHSIVIDPVNPDVFYAATDGGIFISTDNGETWLSRNAGLQITQYYAGISAHPTGRTIMGGSQDNGTLVSSGSIYWDGFNSGDGGYTAINYKDPVIQYGESQWGTNGAGIVRRDATSFRARNAGIDAKDRGAFIPPLIMDPVTPTTLYFGTHRLYRTVNEGTAWTPISVDLTKGSGTIRTIAVGGADAKYIYVGTSDGNMQVSRDSGATFTLSTGLPNRSITRVVIDKADPLHAVMTFSGFSVAHVWETSDAGTTWRDISGNLIDAPTNSAVIIGTTILVGTDVGVFQTTVGSTSWTTGPPGLPNVIVQDLLYVPGPDLLIASTFGRGMWAYTVGTAAAVLRGDVNGDGVVNAVDALLIQQALVSSSVPPTIYPRGDANCNGRIDSGDVVLVLRAAVGLPNPGACVGTVK
jgi:hypothetical protein